MPDSVQLDTGPGARRRIEDAVINIGTHRATLQHLEYQTNLPCVLVFRGGEDEDHVIDRQTKRLVDVWRCVQCCLELSTRVSRSDTCVDGSVAGLFKCPWHGRGPDGDVGLASGGMADRAPFADLKLSRACGHVQLNDCVHVLAGPWLRRHRRFVMLAP